MSTPGTQGTGRGAWTSRGFPAGFTKMYRRHMSAPATGSEPLKSQDFRAVHYGVLAIQNLLMMDNSSGPGIFGPATDRAVRDFQQAHVPPADGICGPNTMKALLEPVLALVSTQYGIVDRLLYGLVRQESVNDPGAVGYSTPSDAGLVQINLTAHKEVPETSAYNPSYALRWAGSRLKAGHDSYLRTTHNEQLAWNCAVAAHNSPVWANQWAKTGQPPNTIIATYVANVRKFARTG